jgi:hypothetical protein
MKLEFTVDDQKYEFDSRHLSNVEAIALQKSAGMGYNDFLQRLGGMDAEAITAMVWLCQRRGDSTARYSETEFDFVSVVESVDMFDEDGNKLVPKEVDGEAVGMLVVNASGETVGELDLQGNPVGDGQGNGEESPDPTTSSGESGP